MEFELEASVTYIENGAMVSFIKDCRINDEGFPSELKKALEKQLNAFSPRDLSLLLYVWPAPGDAYQETRRNLNLISAGLGMDRSFISIRTAKFSIPYLIYSSSWVHDFLPKLGIGEFEVIEIPRLKDEDKFDDIVKDLNTAKDELYKDRDIGASMASLRNSLRKFKQLIEAHGGLQRSFPQ